MGKSPKDLGPYYVSEVDVSIERGRRKEEEKKHHLKLKP
jgi:hypothetical protein